MFQRAVNFLYTLIIGCLTLQSAQANHMVGGSITYEALGDDNYLLHLDLFYDCTGTLPIGQVFRLESACEQWVTDTIFPGIGTEVSQLCPAEAGASTCQGGAYPGFKHYRFSKEVQLPPCAGGWHVSWETCCRALTRSLVGAQGTYLEAVIHNDDVPDVASPVFTDQRVPRACVDQTMSYNFGVVATQQGHALRYSIIGARRMWDDEVFPVIYQGGFSESLPIPAITLDSLTGQFTFLTPQTGYYCLVLLVSEYTADGVLAGTVMRDIMMNSQPCEGVPPTGTQASVSGSATVVSPNNFEVCHGDAFCFSMAFTDADGGELLQVSTQAAELLPGSTTTITGTDTVTITICWTGDEDHTPVNVPLQASDDACPFANSVIASVNITSLPAATCLPTSISSVGTDTVPLLIIAQDPTAGVVTITQSPEVRYIELVDLHGRRLMQRQSVARVVVLDLQTLPSGIYVVLAHTDAGSFGQRLVKP